MSFEEVLWVCFVLVREQQGGMDVNTFFSTNLKQDAAGSCLNFTNTVVKQSFTQLCHTTFKAESINVAIFISVFAR